MFIIQNTEVYFKPEEDLTHSTVKRLIAEVDSNLANSSEPWDIFVIDMENVNSLDVRGVQLIIKYSRTTLELDKKFILMNVHEDLLRFLKLFRLHTKFPIGINKTSAQLEAEKKDNKGDRR